MMICISSLDWANIAEGVPKLKQQLSLLGGVSLGGVNVCLSSLMCAEEHILKLTYHPIYSMNKCVTNKSK